MMSRQERHRRHAATLVELVAGLAITAVLIGGLASAMTLASRAVPDPGSPMAAGIEGFHAAEQIAGDLYCAQTFSTATATGVVFTVADRGWKATPGAEIIRYAWSGIPGDPLVCQYNSNPQVDLVPTVYEFDLAYEVDTVSETTIAETTTETGEFGLVSFDGWAGITATKSQLSISNVGWTSEYFEYTPPAGTTNLIFTRAIVLMSRMITAPTSFTVGIHRSRNDGTYLPESTPIGTPATVLGSAVPPSVNWAIITLPDIAVTDFSRSDYCLVIQGQQATPVFVHYYNDRNAPIDSTVLRWTTDGGASWEPPSKDLKKNDLRFHLYGKCETTTTEEITVDRYLLKSVRIALQVGDNSAPRVETSIPILNGPEVTLP